MAFYPKSRQGLVIAVVAMVAAAAALVSLVHLHVGALVLMAFVGLYLLRRARQRSRRAARRWHTDLHEHGISHWHSPQGPVLADGGSLHPPRS